MAAAIELQPWTTISGSGSVTITQPVSDWVEASEYSDGLFWINVKHISGGVRFDIETAPADDDSYFSPLFTGVTTTGTFLRISRFADATTPIMRYLRWKATSGTDWSICVRVSAVLKSE